MRHDDAVDTVIMYLQKEFIEDNRRLFCDRIKFGHNVPDISYMMWVGTYLVAEIGTFPAERLTVYLTDETIGTIRWYNKDAELIGIWRKPFKRCYPISQLPSKCLRQTRKHLTDEKH